MTTACLKLASDIVNNYENCGGWGLGYLGITDDDALSLAQPAYRCTRVLVLSVPHAPLECQLDLGQRQRLAK